MAKGYSITMYRAIHSTAALAVCAKLTEPAVLASGGRFLARRNFVKTYEAELNLRAAVVEFDSLEKAQAALESPAYQETLRALGNGTDRHIRIVEGA